MTGHPARDAGSFLGYVGLDDVELGVVREGRVFVVSIYSAEGKRAASIALDATTTRALARELARYVGAAR